MALNNETITLTFCDSGENHVGMKMLGKKVDEGEGYSLEDLERIRAFFEQNGVECELHNLKRDETDDAFVLIMREGAKMLANLDKLKTELTDFEWDRKYFDTRRNRVLNKHARANVCFSDESEEPDYENKKGRIVGWDAVPEVAKIREMLMNIIGEKANGMVCEGNRYFDLKKCGIGFHGDAERRQVIGVRLGESMRMQWCWFKQSLAHGDKFEFVFNDGDMYVMSEKAVGADWKRRNIWTLRHAAGADKYLKEKR